MTSTLCQINMAEGTPKSEISSSHGRVHALESGHGGAAVRALPGEDPVRLGLQQHSRPWDAGQGSQGQHQSTGSLQTLTAEIWPLRGLNHLQSSEAIEKKLNIDVVTDRPPLLATAASKGLALIPYLWSPQAWSLLN